MRALRQVAFALMVLGTPSLTTAQPILIANPGFESDSVPPGAFHVLVPQGWSLYDPGNIVNQTINAVGVIRPLPGVEFFPNGVPESNNVALVFLSGNQSAEAGLQQILASVLQSNTRYVLSVYVGNIASGTSLPGSADGGGVFYDLDGFPGYRIDLFAGNSVLASDNNSLAGLIPEGEFRLSTLQFVTGSNHPLAGQPLGVRLVNLHMPGTTEAPNIEVDFDHVTLTAVSVPEPTALLLLVVTFVTGIVAKRLWNVRPIQSSPIVTSASFERKDLSARL